MAPIGHQSRAVLHLPKQSIETGKAFRIAMPHHAIGEIDEGLRNPEPCPAGRGGRLLGKEIRCRFAAAPEKALRPDPSRQASAGGVSPGFGGTDLRQSNGEHHNSESCSGGGAKRARKFSLSIRAPGVQSCIAMKARAFLRFAPIVLKS